MTDRFKSGDAWNEQFYMCPKSLILNETYKDLSFCGKMIYMLMRDRLSLSVKHGWVDDNGDIYFKFGREELASQLHTSVKSVARALSEMKKLGLLDCVRVGLCSPNKYYLRKLEPYVPPNVQKIDDNRTNSGKANMTPLKGQSDPSDRVNLTLPQESICPPIYTDNTNTNKVNTEIFMSDRSDTANNFTETTKNVVAYLNEKAGTSYRATSKKTIEHIKARMKEGFNLSDFKKVVDLKCREWLRDEKMAKYVRPDTLFGTKMDWYLNQKPQQKRTPNLNEGRWIL